MACEDIYLQIKKDYIAGLGSYRKLAEKYDVPRSNLERRAKNEQWSELKRQAEVKAEAKMMEEISTSNSKIDTKYFSLVDRLLDRAEEVIENTKIWQPTNLKEMATALKYIKECKGTKTAIDLREQEARIAKLEREATGNGTGDENNCGVVLLPAVADKLTPPSEEDEDDG